MRAMTTYATGRMVPRIERAAGLERYFEPLSDIAFPDELVFLGSGATPPDAGWRGKPSIRINDKTLDLYPEYPIFGVITQILSTPKVLRHPLFSSGERPWLWQFMNEIGLESSRRRSRGEPPGKYRLIGAKGLKDTPFYRSLRCRYTTGSLVVLFLLYAPVKRVMIAGYDGYKKEGRFMRADGKAWHGRHHGHDLGAEWGLIELAAAMARAGGKDVEIAKEGVGLTVSS